VKRARELLVNAAPVGGGLVLVGLAAYVVLALAGHTLPAKDYTAAANMFLITAIVGPGVFAAVEQQANREVSGGLSVGRRIAPSIWALAVVTVGYTLLICAGVLAASPVLVPRVFAGHSALVAATILAVLGAAAAYLLRGVFGGQRRYRWYGVSLAGEGIARLVPCLALVLFGWASADRFGFVFALGCGLAAAVTLPALFHGARQRGFSVLKVPARDAENANSRKLVAELAGAVGYLAGASVLVLMMTNLGPVVLTSRLAAAGTPGGAELAASFLSLFLLARIPLFLFGPVQAFLLPALTAAAERRDGDGVLKRVRLAILAVLAVGVPGVLVIALLGPWASRLLFNAPVTLTHSTATLLAIGTVAMMAAQIFQPALVALGRNRAATTSWVVASVVFVGLLFTPTSLATPLAATIAAQVIAPLLVTVLMGASLRRALRALTTTGPERPRVGATVAPLGAPSSDGLPPSAP
jgi:O-antigen/teichoic acid export membrane protein